MKKLLFLFLVFKILVSNAQFQSNGPYFGFVHCFAKIDSFLFTGTATGAFRSSDNGATWQQENNGLADSGVVVGNFAVIGDKIFASTQSIATFIQNNLFLSTDNGNHWSPSGNGLYGGEASAILFHDTTMLAATSGIYRSTDTGSNWHKVSNIQVNNFDTLGSLIFASGDPGGFYVSADNGETWTQRNNNLLGDTTIKAFVVTGTKIFASTIYGFYLSTDSGANWSPRNNGLASLNLDRLIVQDTDFYVAVADSGVYVSHNYGVNWAPTGPGLNPNAAWALFSNNGNIFAGTFNRGIYRSTNNGGNWEPINNGLTADPITSLAINGSHIFAAGNYDAVYVSGDKGGSWAEPEGASSFLAECLAVHDSVLYAGSFAGLYVSYDNDSSWVYPLNYTSIGVNIVSFAFRDSFIFIGGTPPLQVSTDGGNHWYVIGSGLPSGAWVNDFAFIDTILFASTYQNGVYMSTDNANHWTAVNYGLDTPRVGSIVAVDSYLFAATPGGLFMSPNNGNSWTIVNAGPEYNYQNVQLGGLNAATHPLATHGTNVYEAVDSGRLFYSADYGSTWSEIFTGFPTSFTITSIAADDSMIYVGTLQNGVWQNSLVNIATTVKQTVFNQQAGFKIYPNPTQNNFIIETTTTPWYPGQQLQLSDLTGQLLLSQPIQNSKTTIDASALAAGVYLVSLKGSEGVSTERLVISR